MEPIYSIDAVRRDVEQLMKAEGAPVLASLLAVRLALPHYAVAAALDQLRAEGKAEEAHGCWVLADATAPAAATDGAQAELVS